ncbi:hypothetical protein LLE32_02465 [Neisseria gonorrhoeae]|nr:hypothetical protein LLE32_02465 [Neisseria gonorrhoeae]
MKYYGTAAYGSPDWGMERYYAREDMRQALDGWEAENRILHESGLIEIAKKSARSLSAMRTANLTARRIGKRTLRRCFPYR